MKKYKHHYGYDLLVTDLPIPNTTAPDLAKELLQVRPGLPIMLCTKYIDLITEERAKRVGIKAFVMKFFVISEIAETILFSN